VRAADPTDSGGVQRESAIPDPIQAAVGGFRAPMDALMANYASDSDSSDGGEPPAASASAPEVPEASAFLPPPPLDLLQPPNFVGMVPRAPFSSNLRC
jgi:hypothetical protein